MQVFANIFSAFLFNVDVCVTIFLPDKPLEIKCVSLVICLMVNGLPFLAGGLNVEGEADSWDFGVGV